MSERDLLREVKSLWDKGDFYSAHEVLEDIWRLFPKEDKFSRNCYQGLIRLAIAYNHYICGRRESCIRVLKMVYYQLQPCRESFRGIDIAYLLEYISKHLQILEAGGDVHDFPIFPSSGDF